MAYARVDKERAGNVREARFRLSPPPVEGERSLAEFAYKAMRRTLRAGGFRPGEHLRETEVAGWLGISRTPVREAMRRLISEGLLSNGPWNGAIVAVLDMQQLVELYTVRESLEGTAAALAAKHASEPEIRNLRELLKREAGERDDPERLVEINFELHRAIHCAAHNRYLLQSLGSVVDTLGLLRHSTFVLPGSARQAHQDHLAIVSAIGRRDADQAERLTRRHVRHALALRLRLSQHPETAVE